MASKSYLMPACTTCETGAILDGILSLRGDAKLQAAQMASQMGPRELCLALHAMRRWYSYNTWNSAKKILPHTDALSLGMDLAPKAAVGAYRGFHVDRDSPLLDLDEGDVIALPVERNNGCSSWTLSRDKANLFSGASKKSAGIVIRLVDAKGVQPFIAPPCRSEPWFNQLYERTMNRSFRFKEEEYAIFGRKLRVEIVAIKMR